MHLRPDGDLESFGLTAGARHVFISGPVRLDSVAVAAMYSILDALLRGERRIVEDQHGNPRLI